MTTIADIEQTIEDYRLCLFFIKVLLLMEGKEVYRGVQFINLEELKQTVDRYMTLSKDE